MMSTSKITLFDLAPQGPNRAWSLNTWKTRLVLNYKGLDYETEWLELSEIKAKLEPLLPGHEAYTIPTVKMPDNTYVMESWEIAQEIEKQHPSPSLHLDSPFLEKYNNELNQAFIYLRGELCLGVPTRMLKELNHPFWRETREKFFGMPLEQYAAENGGEKAFKGAAPHLRNITALLKENGEGALFLGKEVSYVDFVHAGFLLMFRALGEPLWQSVLEATGEPEVHLKFLEALKPWTERDSY